MLFSDLPVELQNEILLILDGVSLARAECVCKIWHGLLCREIYNMVWRRNCLSDIDENVLVEITGREDIMFSEPNCSERFDRSTTPSTHVWKTIYKRWHIARKVGKWPVMEGEIQAHNGEVCDIKIFGDIVYTAGFEGVIKSWDSWTGVCLRTFQTSHFHPVTTIALFQANPVNQQISGPHQLRLLSGSEDHNIGIWDVETGICKGILRGHNNTVSCLAISEHYVVSASFDETIKIWDLQKDVQSACIKTLKGHYSPVLYLSVWKTKATSVSHNAVKLWSLETGDCLHTFQDFGNVNTSFTQGCALRGSHALLLKSDGELKFCDFSGRCMLSNEEICHNYRLLDYKTTQCSRLSCLATYGNLMAVASDSGMVFLFHYEKDWSEKLSNIHHKVQCGSRSVCCITLSDDGEGPVLVTGCSDGVVKLFRWFSPYVS